MFFTVTFLCPKYLTLPLSLQIKRPNFVCLLLASSPHPSSPTTSCDYCSFIHASDSEFLKILSDFSNKQSYSNLIPTWLRKECASFLIPGVKVNDVVSLISSTPFLRNLLFHHY